MTLTPTHATIESALAEAFPGIEFTIHMDPRNEADVTWTDGPTEAQVATVVEPLWDLWRIGLARHLSPGFRALLEDDFEHFLGEPYEKDRRYVATFIDGKIVRDSRSITSGDVLVRRLAQVTAVDGDRCIWQVLA